MQCSYCHADIPETSRFCPFCGQPSSAAYSPDATENTESFSRAAARAAAVLSENGPAVASAQAPVHQTPPTIPPTTSPSFIGVPDGQSVSAPETPASYGFTSAGGGAVARAPMPGQRYVSPANRSLSQNAPSEVNKYSAVSKTPSPPAFTASGQPHMPPTPPQVRPVYAPPPTWRPTAASNPLPPTPRASHGKPGMNPENKALFLKVLPWLIVILIAIGMIVMAVLLGGKNVELRQQNTQLQQQISRLQTENEDLQAQAVRARYFRDIQNFLAGEPSAGFASRALFADAGIMIIRMSEQDRYLTVVAHNSTKANLSVSVTGTSIRTQHKPPRNSDHTSEVYITPVKPGVSYIRCRCDDESFIVMVLVIA